MSEQKPDLNPNDDQFLRMMEAVAVYDENLECPYCEHGPLEPDYDNCPECNRRNPLAVHGCI